MKKCFPNAPKIDMFEFSHFENTAELVRLRAEDRKKLETDRIVSENLGVITKK